MNEIGTSEELIDLVFAALDHGIESVSGGGPLIPFALTETAGQRGSRGSSRRHWKRGRRGRGNTSADVFAQRYRPGRRLKRFGTIGNAAFVGGGDPLL